MYTTGGRWFESAEKLRKKFFKKGNRIILFLERKKKTVSFFQGIETSIHFLGMKQKTISQGTSNDKRVEKKNKQF